MPLKKEAVDLCLPLQKITVILNLFSLTSRIIITCSNRLSPWLQKEVEELGFKTVRIFKTGVELQGSMQDCIKLNLNLRCASQVLFSIKEFRALNADDLYKVLADMPWEAMIPAEEYFSISSNVSNETITNNLFANVKVKDAIADRFREKTGVRPNSGSELNGAVVHLYWKDELAEIFIDTSGETLSKHGYRKIPGKAPMLESLAAATLLASTWNRQSAFINPMCGSGTIAIEAAMMATNRRPGLYRSNYSFMHVLGYEQVFYDNEYKILEQQVTEAPKGLRIIASDISEDAVNITKINAGIAGVEDLIELQVCDFDEATVPEEDPGAVYFNPEYGDRLGVEDELQATYKRIGDFLRKSVKDIQVIFLRAIWSLVKKSD